MTSISKGRGWARVAESENGLRRPGRPVSPKTPELDELVSRIYSDLSIETLTPLDRLHELISFIESFSDSHSAENLDKLCKQALDDRCFGIKLIKLYKHEYPRIKKENSLFMRELLRWMQKCYQTSEELRKENPIHFANLTWMLGAVLQNGFPVVVRVIGPALIHCLSLLLESGTEEDIETVAIQIYLTGIHIIKEFPTAGPQTDSVDSGGLHEVINKARKILVERNVSARSRALLLLIIDLSNQRYEPLTGDLQMFYATCLGTGCTQVDDTKTHPGQEFNSQSYLYGILMEGIESTTDEIHIGTTPQEVPNRNLTQPPTQRTSRTGGSSGSVPRAIRGSGASDNPKDHRNEKKFPRGYKEKLTDEQVWSAKQNTGSKVWGHDDRFDNDYE